MPVGTVEEGQPILNLAGQPLLKDGQIQLHNPAAEKCCEVALPCYNCQTDTTQANYSVLISGMNTQWCCTLPGDFHQAQMDTLNLWADGGGPFSPVIVHQSSSQPCNYSGTGLSHFLAAEAYSGDPGAPYPGGCAVQCMATPGEFVWPYFLVIQSDRIFLRVGDSGYYLFWGNLYLSMPIDCNQTYIIDNDLIEDPGCNSGQKFGGGTATVTPT
ncbi:MAG: hypothetical protein KAY37_01060 [Phycisphaerae bacterium]|nr:hypothetical protein [Phycisphaerae bacterium]